MADSRVPTASRAAEKWGGITTEMKLYEREHRRYILRRMVYELFGVGGENGGRPISAAAAAKPVSGGDARSGAETTAARVAAEYIGKRAPSDRTALAAYVSGSM